MKAFTVGVGILVAGLAASASTDNGYRFNGGYGGIHIAGTHLQAGSVTRRFVNNTAGSVHALPSGMTKIAVRGVSDLPATSLSAVAGLSGDFYGPVATSGGEGSRGLATFQTAHASLAADLATGDVDASRSAAGSIDLSGLTDTVLGVVDGVVDSLDSTVGLGLDLVIRAVADSTQGLSYNIAGSNRGPVDGVNSPRALPGLTIGSDSIIGAEIIESAPLTTPSAINAPAGISTPTITPLGVFPRGQYEVYGSMGVGYATATVTYEIFAPSKTGASQVLPRPTVESVPHIKAVDLGLSMAGSNTDITTTLSTTITSFITESQVETLYSYYSATPTQTEATSEPCTPDTTTITVTVVSASCSASRSTTGKYSNTSMPLTGGCTASTFRTFGSITVSSTHSGIATSTPFTSISAGTASTSSVNAAILAGFAALALFV